MKKIILNVPIEQAETAAKIAQDFHTWFNKPDVWEKKKIEFEKHFTVHETKTGTIVVNVKK